MIRGVYFYWGFVGPTGGARSESFLGDKSRGWSLAAWLLRLRRRSGGREERGECLLGLYVPGWMRPSICNMDVYALEYIL